MRDAFILGDPLVWSPLMVPNKPRSPQFHLSGKERRGLAEAITLHPYQQFGLGHLISNQRMAVCSR